MGPVEHSQIRSSRVIEYDRIHEAARTRDDCRAAARATKDRNAPFPASVDIDFPLDLRRSAKNDEMRERLPQSQNFVARLGFSGIEQGLVQGQIFSRRPESEVEQFHAANRVLDGVYAAVAPWTFVARDLDW